MNKEQTTRLHATAVASKAALWTSEKQARLDAAIADEKMLGDNSFIGGIRHRLALWGFVVYGK